MHSPTFVLWTLVLAIEAAEALVPTSPQVFAQSNPTTSPSQETATVDTLWQVDTSTNSFNVSAGVMYYCNTNFGIGIDSHSCYDAIAAVPGFDSRAQMTFGERDTGMRYDIQLPKWFISRAYTLTTYGSESIANFTL